MTLQQLRYAITIAEKGSMNEAAKELFVSQPSLSQSLKELETEIGIAIFHRTNRGITVTSEGEEFLGYARQIQQQCELVEERYRDNEHKKKRFHVSTQHYTFAVQAFVKTVQQYGMDEYEFAIFETRTQEVMEDVKNFRSDIGILYMNEFNQKIIKKLLKEQDLTFTELFECKTYVYLRKGHPLEKQNKITLEQLQDYPCISFDQGNNNSFYLAEEVLSDYDYKQLIRVNDRATVLNMMIGLDGYTLCSGIICEDLNGEGFTAVPLDVSDVMRIGYIKRKDILLSKIGQLFVSELEKSKEDVL